MIKSQVPMVRVGRRVMQIHTISGVRSAAGIVNTPQILVVMNEGEASSIRSEEPNPPVEEVVAGVPLPVMVAA